MGQNLQITGGNLYVVQSLQYDTLLLNLHFGFERSEVSGED